MAAVQAHAASLLGSVAATVVPGYPHARITSRRFAARPTAPLAARRSQLVGAHAHSSAGAKGNIGSMCVREAALVSATLLGSPWICFPWSFPCRSSARLGDRWSLFLTGAKPYWKPSLLAPVSNYWRQSVAAPSLVCTADFDAYAHENWLKEPQLLPIHKELSRRCIFGLFGARIVLRICKDSRYRIWDGQFLDDGAELEVRVRIPDGMVGEDDATVSARHVQVDSQDDALFVVVRTAEGPRMVFSASRLYGRVKSSESVWYIDDDEVVLSLKKMDSDVKWPSLEEAWSSLTVGVSQLLKGTSVYIVGGSSEINWAVAKELAAGLEYVPLSTQQLVQDYTKKSPAELAAEEGDQSVSETESAILDSLSSHVRCVVASLGGSQGVGLQYGNWNSLHAGFTVWINLTTATDEGSAEKEVARAKQGGLEAYAQADVAVALGGWDENSAKPAAEGALRALKALLEADKELPSKKSLYVRLGCRGDWPNIMPPGWNPFSGKEEATSTAYY